MQALEAVLHGRAQAARPLCPPRGGHCPGQGLGQLGVTQGRVVQSSHLVWAPKGLLGTLFWLAPVQPQGWPCEGQGGLGPSGVAPFLRRVAGWPLLPLRVMDESRFRV